MHSFMNFGRMWKSIYIEVVKGLQKYGNWWNRVVIVGFRTVEIISFKNDPVSSNSECYNPIYNGELLKLYNSDSDSLRFDEFE